VTVRVLIRAVGTPAERKLGRPSSVVELVWAKAGRVSVMSDRTVTVR
jgi:hypothetical protein